MCPKTCFTQLLSYCDAFEGWKSQRETLILSSCQENILRNRKHKWINKRINRQVHETVGFVAFTQTIRLNDILALYFTKPTENTYKTLVFSKQNDVMRFNLTILKIGTNLFFWHYTGNHMFEQHMDLIIWTWIFVLLAMVSNSFA